MKLAMFGLTVLVLIGDSAAQADVAFVPRTRLFGSTSDQFFGHSVRSAGDVNGDGYDDVIVGAPLDNSNGVDNGSAFVYSGATGALIHSFAGSGWFDRFGIEVSGAGDVNNDGYDDVIVGALFADVNGTDSGSAFVFSGLTGATIWQFHGSNAGDWFGVAVSDVGDVNNDGFDDVIVGAFDAAGPGGRPGCARVFSGASGVALYEVCGLTNGDDFGVSVCGLGDIDGDGHDDFAVGARFEDYNGADSGTVRVFSGATGQAFRLYPGEAAGDQFGIRVASAGDVDGDGVGDLIVGAYESDINGTNSGRAYVYSGATGALLLPTLNGLAAGDNFGIAVGGLGDLTGDGKGEVFVAAQGSDANGLNSGSVRVISGATGGTLATLRGADPGVQFGYSAGAAGDVDGDGLTDLVVGAIFSSNFGVDSGSAHVYKSLSASCLAPCDGDADHSRSVTFADITQVLARFNAPCAPTISGTPTLVPGYRVDGGSGHSLGGAVSAAGDVNGDGFGDFIIGATGASVNGSFSGQARVISGSNGATLHTLNGTAAGQEFGQAVSGAGDVDGDGFDDVIVGGPNAFGGQGLVRVISGATGADIHSFSGATANGMGNAVSGAGDVDADGFDDFIVGAPGDWTGGPLAGAVIVVSGRFGALLDVILGEPGTMTGTAVGGAGDVNNDGHADYIIGVQLAGSDDRGMAQVYSGADGSLLYQFDGDGADDRFGYSVSEAGDVNGDGYDDVVVGALGEDVPTVASGYVRVFSGQTGAVLHTFFSDQGNSHFGHAVAGAGDVDLDGFADIVVSSPIHRGAGSNAGRARVYSGADGAVLAEFLGDAVGDFFGIAADGAGDLNGDGAPDVIVGAYADDNGGSNSGSVHVYFGFGACELSCTGDADSNRQVNFADITMVLAQFNAVCAP